MPTTTGIATEFIQFSRTSNATVTDSDGKVKWAPHNFLLASEQFDNSNWTKTTTTVAANSFAAPNGTTTADTLTAAGANSTTLQSYTAVAAPHTFGVWLRRKTGTGNIDIAADSGTYTTVTITSSWALYTVTQTPAAGTISAGIRIVTSADEVYAWGAHLYRSDLSMQPNTSAYPTYNPTTPKNLLGFGEDFSGASWSPNNMPVQTNVIIAPNGLTTADKIYPSVNDGSIAQTASATIAFKTFSIYARSAEFSVLCFREPGNAVNGLAYIDLSSGAVTNSIPATATVTATDVGNGWWRVGVIYSSAAVGSVIRFSPANAVGSVASTASGTNGLYVWGAQLSDSASLDPYFPSYSTAPTAAAYYGPRRDFDGSTLACKGLLVEELRTNLLTASQAIGAAPWAAYGTATAGATTTSPDGSSNGQLISVPSAGNGWTSTVATVSAATTYTESVFVKASIGTQITFFMRYYNSGVLTGTTTTTLTISSGVSVGNGWYRLSITEATPASTNQAMLAFLAVNSADAWYLYGAQIEAGSFATSYMPTVATTFQRNADLSTVSTQAFPYSSVEGTVIANVSVFSIANPNNANLWNLYIDGNNSTRDWIWSGAQSTPRFSVTVSGSSQADLTAGTVSANTAFKTASAYKANDFAFSLNASAVAPALSGSVTGASTALQLGRQEAAEQLNGHIRQITYIPRRLSNAELQARTA